MLKDSNIAKILEGNYNNRVGKQQKPNKNAFHNFEQKDYTQEEYENIMRINQERLMQRMQNFGGN